MSDGTSTNRGKLRLTEPSTVTARQMKRPKEVSLKDQERVEELLSLEDRFQDHGEIGRGGMGQVHRVLERTLHRLVAMKLLPVGNTRASMRHRFLVEAQVTGQLEHPNIVPVYELGADDSGVLFFTMRLIEGVNFSDWLHEHLLDSDESVEAALEIFFRVCDALSFAHSRGVVHRDVKPANIMVGEHGQVYLMDWGIARVLGELPEPDASETLSESTFVRRTTTTLTAPAIDERGLILGTYAYMSPEQARSAIDEIDERTDIFALGAVLFRIVTGRAPITGNNPVDVLAKAAMADVPDAKNDVEGMLKRALLDVAMQAMQRKREDRFQTVAALKSAATQILRGRIRYPVTRFKKGDTIVHEGETGVDAYFIRNGTCLVYRKRDGIRHALLTLGPGEVFGETAVFTGQPRNASIEATTDVDVIVVPGRHLAESVGLESWTGAFVRALGSRFSERSQRVVELESRALKDAIIAETWRTLAFTGARDDDGALSLDLQELIDSFSRGLPTDPTLVSTVLISAGFTVTGAGFRRRVTGAVQTKKTGR